MYSLASLAGLRVHNDSDTVQALKTQYLLKLKGRN